MAPFVLLSGLAIWYLMRSNHTGPIIEFELPTLAKLSLGVFAVGAAFGVSYRTFKRARFALSDQSMRSQTVVLLGDTGCGKTSLIRRLYATKLDSPEDPNPTFPTQYAAVYTVTHGVSLEGRNRITRLDLIDHKGSNPGTLVQSWRSLQSQLANPKATCIVLVLSCSDLNSLTKTGKSKSVSNGDWEYLEDQVRRWSAQFLSTIAAHLAIERTQLILFVNKCDLLPNMTVNEWHFGKAPVFGKLSKILLPAIDALQAAFGGSDVQVIFGSAMLGLGIPTLNEAILAQAARSEL